VKACLGLRVGEILGLQWEWLQELTRHASITTTMDITRERLDGRKEKPPGA
jgi:integrase